MTARPRLGPKQSTPRVPASERACRHRGHIPWNAGITGYWRTDALNSSPLFIEALAGLVETHVSHTPALGCAGCGQCAKVAV